MSEPKPGVDEEEVARETCLRRLAAAPRTRSELADTLRQRGISEAASDRVLDRLTTAGLIDDAAFAAAWVESRHYSRGLARRALTVELRRRGVTDTHVTEAVGVLGDDTEAAMARQLIDRRLASVERWEPRKRMRLLMGLLVRRGYPPALAARTVREAMAEGYSSPEANIVESFGEFGRWGELSVPEGESLS
jgi:regulatory protein